MKRSKWLIPGIIAGVVLIIVLMFVGSYNGLVTKREDVRKSLANVQTQYQRRSDLVPNLVSTVKGAANFEQKTLTDVTNARAKATAVTIDPSKATPQQLQQYQNSQGELSQALGRLLAVSEAYPQLTATQNFQDLQTQLEGTENRIAVARKDYNDIAAGYNARIKRFPTVVTAGLFGFDSFPYFQADANAQTAPTVNFGQ
jgi:LemA protein